jgi:hypothetical protein
MALIKQFGKPDILYQCTGGTLAITSNYVLTILALIVLESGKVISTLYHGQRLGHRIDIGQKVHSSRNLWSFCAGTCYFRILAAMLKATNSGPKHYKLIWRNLYFITLNGYIVVILWWMLLKFSGRTKER